MVREYGLQVGRPDSEQDQFYKETACERDLQNPGEMILGLTDMLGNELVVLRVYLVHL